jgi:UDP-N-acetylglucosamine 2-epimerase (non-hydrolysing)
LRELRLEPEKYFLVTMHREENVDVEARLRSLTQALILLRKEYKMPIICSLHPRTKNRMQRFDVDVKNKQIRFHAPFGFFDFIALERNAFCVLSDSGTVQEECCISRVANVTIRDVTERPETIECGSNMLSGADPDTIIRCVRTVLDQRRDWTVPSEYLEEHVSNTVAKIVLGYLYRHR